MNMHDYPIKKKNLPMNVPWLVLLGDGMHPQRIDYILQLKVNLKLETR